MLELVVEAARAVDRCERLDLLARVDDHEWGRVRIGAGDAPSRLVVDALLSELRLQVGTLSGLVQTVERMSGVAAPGEPARGDDEVDRILRLVEGS
ncbi:MAG: hypothetical protein ACRCZP_01750 [Phycicoccus sp.]